MELEEAIKFLENMNNTIKQNKLFFNEDNIQVRVGIKISKSTETILQALKNSIPKKKIEDKILELHEAIALENNSMYGHGDEEYIKELEFKINALQELLEDKYRNYEYR